MLYFLRHLPETTARQIDAVLQSVPDVGLREKWRGKNPVPRPCHPGGGAPAPQSNAESSSTVQACHLSIAPCKGPQTVAVWPEQSGCRLGAMELSGSASFTARHAGKSPIVWRGLFTGPTERRRYYYTTTA